MMPIVVEKISMNFYLRLAMDKKRAKNSSSPVFLYNDVIQALLLEGEVVAAVKIDNGIRCIGRSAASGRPINTVFVGVKRNRNNAGAIKTLG